MPDTPGTTGVALPLPVTDDVAPTPEPLVCSDTSVEHFHERSNCIQCHRIYCPHYASEIDNNFCRVCLTDNAAEVHVHPLKDEEGISHAGKWILPQGSIYKTLPRAIADFPPDNVELENYLAYLKTEVQATETKLQYLRIAESTAKIEKDHRQMLVDRQLRGIKIPTNGASGIKVGADPKAKLSPTEKLADLAKTLKAMGITKEMLEALSKAKSGKP